MFFSAATFQLLGTGDGTYCLFETFVLSVSNIHPLSTAKKNQLSIHHFWEMAVSYVGINNHPTPRDLQNV
jgi:hypothetical protein